MNHLVTNIQYQHQNHPEKNEIYRKKVSLSPVLQNVN